jgi:hypothetical protein
MKFSVWKRWDKRNSLSGMESPGIYAIAYSRKVIAETEFDFIREIVYFGMTNSKGGMRSRLRAFDRTISGFRGHGGAKRVIFRHPNYASLVSKLYVSIWRQKCDVTSLDPDEWRKKGRIAKREYDCIARYLEIFGDLPEFNDMKRSPKK